MQFRIRKTVTQYSTFDVEASSAEEALEMVRTLDAEGLIEDEDFWEGEANYEVE